MRLLVPVFLYLSDAGWPTVVELWGVPDLKHRHRQAGQPHGRTDFDHGHSIWYLLLGQGRCRVLWSISDKKNAQGIRAPEENILFQDNGKIHSCLASGSSAVCAFEATWEYIGLEIITVFQDLEENRVFGASSFWLVQGRKYRDRWRSFEWRRLKFLST